MQRDDTRERRRVHQQEQLERDVAALRRWRWAPRQLSLDAYLAGYQAGRQKQMQQLDAWVARPVGVAAGRNLPAWNAILHQAAERAALYDGLPSWGRMRTLIWERDGGVCWKCREAIPWRYYELGHLVDRVVGGLDIPENLVVMCISCNRLWKPLHEMIEEAERWANNRRPAVW